MGTEKNNQDAPLGNVESAQPQEYNTQPQVTQASVPSSQDYSRDIAGYENSVELLKKKRDEYAKYNETEDQRKAREKRERAQKVIGAVSDGLRALSNLYFTTKGAPNMYHHDKESALAGIDKRHEELKREREAGKDAWLNYGLKIVAEEAKKPIS